MEFVKVLILGARRGGTHVLEVMIRLGAPVEGIYDQESNLPTLREANARGIPVYAGAWSCLSEMLHRCGESPRNHYYVYLPSRDPRFRSFAHRHLAQARREGIANLTVLEMDTHFGDYASPAELTAAWQENHRRNAASSRPV